MMCQELNNKLRRGDKAPFYMSECKSYNDEVGAYFPDNGKVWVYNIYKKDLQQLGATILKSELGGRIGFLDGFSSDWFFLISRDDYDKIMKEWEQKIGAEIVDDKPTLNNLRQELKKRYGLISIPELQRLIDELEETDNIIALKKEISGYKYMNIDIKTFIDMMNGFVTEGSE
jgi:hypothetical protein